ncbi:hypothetical protein GGR28_001469 [Lewinella aquimaris]|uniref:Uncharacterized protein n=1 Tax=Neolewinella aquimaris TaxID=1835722 RepID=A0A840E545_9BACT|nr:hypothetical protein [Neolewinella aquimaris]MBB4078852.1 hypothetical protein [Neolewinella aquimaris]
MNYLVAIASLILAVNSFSRAQTLEIERKNLLRLYEEDIINADAYRDNADRFSIIINDLGGYPKLPLSADNQINFGDTLITGLPKKTNFNALREWSAMNFGSFERDGTLYEDVESGRLIVSGSIIMNKFKDARKLFRRNDPIEVRCHFILNAYVKDQKVKVEFIAPKFGYKYGWISVEDIVYSETIRYAKLSEMLPVTSASPSYWKGDLDLLMELPGRFDDILNSIKNYLADHQERSDF